MTIRPSVRRRLARTAPPVGAGGLALATASYAGASVWAAAACTAVSTLIAILPQLLPQESEHRRDVWRDWLRHRERMTRLRLTASQTRSHATRTPVDTARRQQGEEHHRVRQDADGGYRGVSRR